MIEHIETEISLLKRSTRRLRLINAAYNSQEVINARTFVDKAINTLENELRNPKLK